MGPFAMAARGVLITLLLTAFPQLIFSSFLPLSSFSKPSNQWSQNQLAKRFSHGAPDPELNMDAYQLISTKGYPAESYEVQTTDGYRLTLHRIPYGRNESSGGNRPVVFLQHGLLCDSTNFITDLANESLAFILADSGFDVWLGNFRGNTYSNRHAWLDPKGHDYWKFTWDEMAKYDLPTMINKALAVSGQSDLYYVGHSQGTLTAFAAFGKNKDLAKRVRKFFALAPVATVRYIEGPLRLIAKWSNQLSWFLEKVGVDNFLPNSWMMKVLAKYFCGWSVTNPLCEDFLFLVAGPDSNQMNTTRIPIYITHTPAGTSTRNILHFGQMVQSGQFQMFDFGSNADNLKQYGQATPPVYNVTDMEVPTVVFWGSNDWLADSTDVNLLVPKIPHLVDNFALEGFNHLDFIWGMRAAPEIYSKIVRFIKADQITTTMSSMRRV